LHERITRLHQYLSPKGYQTNCMALLADPVGSMDAPVSRLGPLVMQKDSQSLRASQVIVMKL